MTLQQDIDTYKAGFKTRVPEDKQAIMAKATQDLRDSGIMNGTIKVGDKLPNFSLNNQRGERIASDILLKDRPLIISFFRGVWCPYCNMEIKALETFAEQFRAAGANIVLISPQLQESGQKSVKDNNLSFDVLSDVGNAYAKQLGITFALPHDLRDVYSAFGIDLPKHNGDDSWVLPMPTRLIVDQSGTIIYADINPDYTDRPDPSETLAALTKLSTQ